MLVPVLGAFLFSGEAALLTAQFLQLTHKVPRLFHILAVTIDGEVLKTHLDAHGPMDDGQLSRVSTVIDKRQANHLPDGM